MNSAKMERKDGKTKNKVPKPLINEASKRQWEVMVSEMRRFILNKCSNSAISKSFHG